MVLKFLVYIENHKKIIFSFENQALVNFIAVLF